MQGPSVRADTCLKVDEAIKFPAVGESLAILLQTDYQEQCGEPCNSAVSLL